MTFVLIDTSVWIDYFKGSGNINNIEFEELIDSNKICTNDLILSELIPSLHLRKEIELIDILQTIRRIPIEINWNEIIELQKNNLKCGLNNVGIPDLIIVQNLIQNNLSICTLDKHFRLMAKFYKYVVL